MKPMNGRQERSRLPTKRLGRSEFRAQLDRQLKFIERSAAAYDDAQRDDAIRIGTALRVIFHQTDKSTSLLRHLQAERIKVRSTAQVVAVPIAHHCLNIANNLILDPFTGECRAAPSAEMTKTCTWLSAEAWWRVEPILAKPGLQVSRRSLVCWAVNLDGGAHVDDEHVGEYAFLLDGMDLGLSVTNNSTGVSSKVRPSELHLAALRQCGYEVLHSPAILALAGR